MNRSHAGFRMLAAAALALLAGCTSVATYRTDYVKMTEVPAAERLAGRGLVYTQADEDAYVFSGNPTSFTGSASTLKMPLGLMNREIALSVFGAAFIEGAEHSNALPAEGRHAVIVHPSVTGFEYGYPQLKNLGFAITPEARVQMKVRVLDPGGAALFERSYDSGIREAGSYMLDFSPEERVSKLAHQEIADLLQQAVKDIREYLAGAAAPATPAP
jgi:hypothetical protein